jgi:hypothetical protein
MRVVRRKIGEATLVRKPSWPKFKFLGTGPKLKGDFPHLGFGWELDFYDFLHRWNGGVPLADSFKVKSWRGDDTVARVRHFYGISEDRSDERDLRNAVYFNWDSLPRAAIPMAPELGDSPRLVDQKTRGLSLKKRGDCPRFLDKGK